MKFPLPMLLLTLGLPAATHAAYGAAGFGPVLMADGPLTGKVLDENGAGLPGVTVRVKGGAAGTATDDQGNFTLTGVPTDATLLISYVGYNQQEVKANRTGNVTVRLLPTQGQLR